MNRPLAARPPLLTALLRREGLLVCLVTVVFFVSVPLAQGELGLGSDALNHHFYLGWTAQQHRFDLDFLAAGYQAYTFPYLYWPLYQMGAAGWSGVAVGAMLAALQAVLVAPPVWLLARACMPGATWFDFVMRVLGVALAFLTGVMLSVLDATMNDLLAAAPLLWSMALAVQAMPGARSDAPGAVRWPVLLSGLCAGAAVAAKLSNGPLAILMPGLWWLCGRGWRSRMTTVALGSAATLLAFALLYGYWGWLLWHYFGNPIFPFHHDWFEPLRRWAGMS
jgi:hypothetical protein